MRRRDAHRVEAQRRSQHRQISAARACSFNALISVRIDPMPPYSRFDFPAARMVRAAMMEPMLACLLTLIVYRPRRAWIRGRSGGRGGIGFGRSGIFRIAVANPGFALDRLYTFCKSCKRAVWGAAGKIRTPRTILRVCAVQSGPDKNRDRDDRSPRHLGLPVSGRLKGLSRGLIVPMERRYRFLRLIL